MRKSARGARAALTPGEGMVQGSKTAGRATGLPWGCHGAGGHVMDRVKPTSGSKMM